MRTKFIYFFAILLTLSVSLTSCKDDKNNAPAREIAKEYNNAVITNDNELIVGATVTLEAKSDDVANVILFNAIPGLSRVELDATVVTAKASYGFIGTKSFDGMTVDVSGTIIDGVAKVNINTKMENAIVGKWNKAEENCVTVTYKNATGKVMWGGQEITNEEFSGHLTEMVNSFAIGIATDSISLTFDNKGFIGGKVNLTEIVSGTVDGMEIPFSKVARYYYNPTSKLLSISAFIDLDTDSFKASKASPNKFTSNLTIPFTCEFIDGSMYATLGWDFIKMFIPLIPQGEVLDGLIAQIQGMLPPELDDYAPMIENLIKNLALALKDATEMSITIKMDKVVE